MPPTDEAHFITLWQQGLTIPVIAERLGIPEGTAKSRAHTLQQQGKIAPRPRGGRRERQRAVQTSAHHGAVHTTLHRAESVQTSAELPIPAAIAMELMRLWAAIDALRHDLHPPVQNTVQSLPEPEWHEVSS